MWHSIAIFLNVMFEDVHFKAKYEWRSFYSNIFIVGNYFAMKNAHKIY